MAENLYKKTGSRMCLAIAGNAGPDTVSGFTAGMYTVSVIFDGKLYSRSINHKGRTRDMNIEFMTQSAFDTILRIIDNKKMDDVR
jgi:nicotinamide mononucleotide (NMN) deamidase PncC